MSSKPRLLCLIILVAAMNPVWANSLRPVDLPADGAEMNRTHAQFRWDSFADQLRGHGVPWDGYRLEIVEDDGSPDPFDGSLPMMQYEVPRPHRTSPRVEPRTVVTEGLQLGRSYAWRVAARPMGRSEETVSAVRRFTTVPVSPLVPPMTLTVPPGAGPTQPGLTCWSMSRNGSAAGGLILCVEQNGDLAFHFQFPEGRIGDMRLMDNGRLFFLARGRDSHGVTCSVAVVTTLDGKETWRSPEASCKRQIHHEVFPMPSTAPRGANFLLLEREPRIISPFYDIHDGQTYDSYKFYFDLVNEYDRHTKQVVQGWSTYGTLCVDDHLPPEFPDDGLNWGRHPPPADIGHGNAVVYDDDYNRVIVSIRRQSRIIAVDWDTLEVVYEMGVAESYPGGPGWPCGGPDFGDGLFTAQHAPQILPNKNMVIYNNGNYDDPQDAPRQSTAIEIAFDDPFRPTDAWKVYEYGLVLEDLVSPAWAFGTGDSDRMPSGTMLAVDQFSGGVMEADAAENTIWHMKAGTGWPGTSHGHPVTSGTGIYRVEKFFQLIIDTPGDTDGDGDLDMLDLAELQTSYSAPAPARLAFPATLVDHDRNGAIDQQDVALFSYWMTGPGR